MSKFLKAQLNNTRKKDWVNMVKEDLKYLKLDYLGFDGVISMKKQMFANWH